MHTTAHNFKTLMAVFGGLIEEQLDWQRAYLDSGMCPQVEDNEVIHVDANKGSRGMYLALMFSGGADW